MERPHTFPWAGVLGLHSLLHGNTLISVFSVPAEQAWPTAAWAHCRPLSAPTRGLACFSLGRQWLESCSIQLSRRFPGTDATVHCAGLWAHTEGRDRVLFIFDSASSFTTDAHSVCCWTELRDPDRWIICLRNSQKMKPTVASLALDITYSHNSSVVTDTPVLLNFQNFPQTVDHSLVSGCVGVIYWSLVYIQLWTRRSNVSFIVGISRETGKLRARGYDIPAAGGCVRQCSPGRWRPLVGSALLMEGSLGDRPASGTMLLCGGPGLRNFPLSTSISSFVKGRGCSRSPVRSLSTLMLVDLWLKNPDSRRSHESHWRKGCVGKLSCARAVALAVWAPAQTRHGERPALASQHPSPVTCKQPAERPSPRHLRKKNNEHFFSFFACEKCSSGWYPLPGHAVCCEVLWYTLLTQIQVWAETCFVLF